MTDDITDDVKQFILQHIDSIAQMEGLLLLRVDPQKEWNAEAISRELFIDKSQATSLLDQLAERGFIGPAESGTPLYYQYRPKSPEWAVMLNHVADVYRRYLVPITNLIHSKSKTRIQEFADAFKIRKD